MKIGTLFATSACFAVATAAYGSTLNIDFNGAASGNTFTGDGPASGDDSNTWRGVEVPNTPGYPLSQTTGFLAADNTPTTVTLNLANALYVDNYNGPANNALQNDYIGQFNGTMTLTIGGLVPGSGYSIYLFGSNSRAGAGANFNVNNQGVISIDGGNGLGDLASMPFTANRDYAFFTATANSSGQLIVTDGGSDNNIFNGFQLIGNLNNATPEPMAISLLSVAGLAALRRKR